MKTGDRERRLRLAGLYRQASWPGPVDFLGSDTRSGPRNDLNWACTEPWYLACTEPWYLNCTWNCILNATFGIASFLIGGIKRALQFAGLFDLGAGRKSWWRL